jgi:3D (Asp-Asp-Asp) domain-containing protein
LLVLILLNICLLPTCLRLDTVPEPAIIRQTPIPVKATPAPVPVPAPSRSDTSRTIEVVATAYTYTGNRTKCGTLPGRGTVAVDPRVIRLGSILLIDGKRYVAEDTGSAIKGMRIDIFLTSRSACLQFGRRVVMVRIERVE